MKPQTSMENYRHLWWNDRGSKERHEMLMEREAELSLSFFYTSNFTVQLGIAILHSISLPWPRKTQWSVESESSMQGKLIKSKNSMENAVWIQKCKWTLRKRFNHLLARRNSNWLLLCTSRDLCSFYRHLWYKSVLKVLHAVHNRACLFLPCMVSFLDLGLVQGQMVPELIMAENRDPFRLTKVFKITGGESGQKELQEVSRTEKDRKREKKRSHKLVIVYQQV